MTHKDFAKVSHSCINREYLAKDSKSTHSMMMHTENSKYSTTEMHIWNIWNKMLVLSFYRRQNHDDASSGEFKIFNTLWISLFYSEPSLVPRINENFPQTQNVQEFNILMHHVSKKASCLLSLELEIDSQIFVLHLPGSQTADFLNVTTMKAQMWNWEKCEWITGL